ncbi:Acid alpha-amylase, partial [Madurella mycetomatis]
SSNGNSYDVSIGCFQSNDQVVEVLGCQFNTADAVGNVTMYMGQGEPKAYVPAATLEGTSICGEITKDAPSNSAAALGATSELLMAVVGGWAAVLVAMD